MGAYVEETRDRRGPVTGLPTGTLGMAGTTAYGPVPHPTNEGRGGGAPALVTSMTEYERIYGGLTNRGRPCRLALAAQLFFANGGRRLYVQRVFVPTTPSGETGPVDDLARAEVGPGADGPTLRWHARWPGSAGSRLRVVTHFRRSENVQVGTHLEGLLPGAAVETAALVAGQPPVLPDDQLPANLRLVTEVDGVLHYLDDAGGHAAPVAGEAAFHVTLDVEVHFGDRVDVYPGLELGLEHPNHLRKVLDDTRTARDQCLVLLRDTEPADAQPAPTRPTALELLAALVSPGEQGVQLSGGSDGGELTPRALRGEAGNPGTSSSASGLAALAEVDDIAIVALPDSTYFEDQESAAEAVDALIAHCEGDRRRFAVIDPPETRDLSEVRAFRSRFDSTFAAMYHPWLRIEDPRQQPDAVVPPALLDVPPSGAVAGILARSDSQRGVHKAPTNLAARGITELVTRLTAAEREMLGLEGVNPLRSFPGRRSRVWGSRTMSSDPEWKYVNIRRLFIYLEHSIDQGTRWAVFEPNDERLWEEVRRTVEDFLTSSWRSGALIGSTPQEAFFVRCDRTTMTQDDLDDGRLVCLVGVAPTRPAEFVVFRIGQWTADSTVPDP